MPTVPHAPCRQGEFGPLSASSARIREVSMMRGASCHRMGSSCIASLDPEIEDEVV
jgi:hypothetical protein